MVSLSMPDCPGTCSVCRLNWPLSYRGILLLLPPGTKGVQHHCIHYFDFQRQRLLSLKANQETFDICFFRVCSSAY